MAETPPDAILEACLRWMRLLRSATRQQAQVILSSDAEFADLTRSQYASALEWLDSAGVHDSELVGLDDAALPTLLLARLLLSSQPYWLDAAADLADDPPSDLVRLAGRLGVSLESAVLVSSGVARKVDVDRQHEVGRRGEAVLAELLARHGLDPVHAALRDDTLGYDIALRGRWNAHLEVKTTTARGRLRVYLSRHEANVSAVDGTWHLVAVALRDNELAAVATINRRSIAGRLPADKHAGGRWESVRLDLAADDLIPGLAFLEDAPTSLLTEVAEINASALDYAWLPSRSWRISVESERLTRL